MYYYYREREGSIKRERERKEERGQMEGRQPEIEGAGRQIDNEREIDQRERKEEGRGIERGQEKDNMCVYVRLESQTERDRGRTVNREDYLQRGRMKKKIMREKDKGVKESEAYRAGQRETEQVMEAGKSDIKQVQVKVDTLHPS